MFLGLAIALLLTVPVATQEPGPRCTAWSQAVPVNLGAAVNTSLHNEFCSLVTIDGHWLYFVANRPDNLQGVRAYGHQDIFISHRKDKDDPAGWEMSVNLGPLVNSTGNEARPSLSWDGTTLYFWTDREDGNIHVYKSTRSKITGKQ